MFSSVRTRLTVWYIGVLALVLVSFSIAVYIMLKRSLYAQLDSDLKATAESTSASLVRATAAGEDLQQAAIDKLNDHIGPDQSAGIFGEDGHPIAENPDLTGRRAQLPQTNVRHDQIYLYNLAEDGGRRVVFKRFTLNSPPGVFFIVVS